MSDYVIPRETVLALLAVNPEKAKPAALREALFELASVATPETALRARVAEQDEQIAALQAKVHLCSGYDRLEARATKLEMLLKEGRNRVAAFVLYERFDDKNLTLEATQKWLHAANSALGGFPRPALAGKEGR